MGEKECFLETIRVIRHQWVNGVVAEKLVLKIIKTSTQTRLTFIPFLNSAVSAHDHERW
jgi:hypothetical protein